MDFSVFSRLWNCKSEEMDELSVTQYPTLSCIELLTFQFVWVIKLWSWHLRIQFIHILPTHSFEGEKQSFEDGRQSFENEKQSFMTS